MLPRLTIASKTLIDFISLTPAEQSVVCFLLTKRSMNVKPLRPTAYLSFQDIADATNVKPTTVAKTISILRRKGWIIDAGKLPRTKDSQQRYRWVLTKVHQDFIDTYTTDAQDANLFIYDNYYWRLGGPLGYQKKELDGQRWVDTSTCPEDVSDYLDRLL